MVGDGPEGQPTEGVDSLTELAELMNDEAEGGEESLDDLEGEESEESEEVEESEEAEESEEEEETDTIIHDGKEVTLTKSEIKALAQQGFDYSKKTMAVAEERKAVEAQRSQAENYRKQHETVLSETVARLQAFSEFMESQLGSPPPIEWAQQDAAYYLAQKELYESRKGQFHKAQAAIQNLQSEQSRQRQDWIVQQADATEAALRGTLPGWSDKTLDELAEYTKGYGLTPETVDIGFVQKGFWELAHKAKAYDALLAAKAKLKPKTSLPRVQKPQASTQPNRAQVRESKALENLKRKPGSIDALADLIG
jgi:hypothetical protein